MTRRLAPIVAVIVSLAGCGGGSRSLPTSPTLSELRRTTTISTPTPTTPTTSSGSPAGTWSGSITDPVSGVGTVQLSLTEVPPNSLLGFWSVDFRNPDSATGTAVGSLASSGYAIAMNVQPPPCAPGSGGPALIGFTLVNIIVTSTRLTADSLRISCSATSLGPAISLSKR